tara:strand:+ start:1731 stop:2174 length:444 start_codon:yes stop_codon:yes gene_type:complete
MTKTTNWTTDFILGTAQTDARYRCKLQAPTWDCSWYWGMGYLGHKDAHFHLDGVVSKHKTNMFDALRLEFGDTLTITKEDDLWTFCELMGTAYALRKTAEVLGRGGVHYTTNPLAGLIKNEKETERINSILLPAIFDQVNSLVAKYR